MWDHGGLVIRRCRWAGGSCLKTFPSAFSYRFNQYIAYSLDHCDQLRSRANSNNPK